MARLWAPSWKCWASALDSQQKLPLSWHCPEASKKGLPSPGSYQNGTKMRSPNPLQGGRGFAYCLPAFPLLPFRILHGFPNAQKPQKWDHDHRNTSKIDPKVLPKASLKRLSNPFWNKNGPTLSSTHYLPYIQQVGHLQKPTVFHAFGYLKCIKN